ncbi:MAG: Uma2 family endonuclease [Myxococcales bacterium]|nr:Uma2 family endonuclease [Myxococcales bacterium]MCB9579000.1 Uma2 family endonuclease [Polyangiaceae bacterium]
MSRRFSFAEYVVLAEDAAVKLEFLNGQVWAMAGGSPEHAAVAGNVVALLNVRLAGKKCRVFTSDLRVRIKATGLGTYPDVSVVCGKLEIDPDDPTQQTVTNPCVLVEVLSPSTEDYDRGDKLAHYQQIPSLQEIVFVAQGRQQIEVVRREADGSWSRHVSGEGESAELSSLGAELPVAKVYENPLAD